MFLSLSGSESIGSRICYHARNHAVQPVCRAWGHCNGGAMTLLDFSFQDYDPETTPLYCRPGTSEATARPAGKIFVAYLDEQVELGWLRASLRAFAQLAGPEAWLCLYTQGELRLAALLESLGEPAHPGVFIEQEAPWPEVLAFADVVLNLSRSDAEARALQTLLMQKQFVSDRAQPIEPFGGRILNYADLSDAGALADLLGALSAADAKPGIRRLALEWLAGRQGTLRPQAVDLALQQGYPKLAARMCGLIFRQQPNLPLPMLEKFMQVAYLADEDSDMEAFMQRARLRLRDWEFRLQRLQDPTRTWIGGLAILDQEPWPDAARAEQARSAYREAFGRCFEYLVSNRIRGEVLEFGTYSGFTARILAEQMREHRFGGGLHLYDSFLGLPEVSTPEDRYSYHVLEQVWAKGSMSLQAGVELRIQAALAQILPPERIHVSKGFFSETLPAALPAGPAALVHIDCDLYESTLCVLKNLLEQNLLQDGCLLLFDDFNCNRAQPMMGERKALHDVFASQQGYSVSRFFNYHWAGEACFVHRNAL